MNRRFQFAVVATSACFVVLLIFGATKGTSVNADSPYTQLGVYSEVLSRIRNDYVEEPDMKAVTLGAINGLLESLDPFASYLNADQYKQYQATKQSGKADVGLILSRRLGYIGIVDAIPGSPADKLGLSTGDVIESINNVATRDMPLAFAEILLQGETGTSIEISVLRLRQSDPQKVTLVRAPISYPAVSSKMVNEPGQPETALISSVMLDDAHLRDIAAKVGELEKQGAKRIVLDLRRCASGTPEQGIALANLFMDKGLITYTQGQKTSRQDFNATASKQITKLPLVVLTNRGTAGAAEIASAALLESKRAQVVGERTYGNAAVRRPVTLDDGSAVIIAVAKYYGPGGKAIQDTGVMPNVMQAQAAEAPDDDDDPTNNNAAPAAPPQTVEDLILQRGLRVK
jgi:carboxyl-terminal processing protease